MGDVEARLIAARSGVDGESDGQLLTDCGELEQRWCRRRRGPHSLRRSQRCHAQSTAHPRADYGSRVDSGHHVLPFVWLMIAGY